MEHSLNNFAVLFSDWCRIEQSRLQEQIRWLESGSRHVAARTGDGPWVDTTENELMRLKMHLSQIDGLVTEHKRHLVD